MPTAAAGRVSYGVAVQIQAYGFLAVFAASLALRAIERRHSQRLPEAFAEKLVPITLLAVPISVFVRQMTATPIMARYNRP
jgi:NhaP-type Na+/H+ or K+/H+ antiporter